MTQSHKKPIEVDGEEKLCLSKFLDGQNEKNVKLDRILGIGGEGLVLKDEISTREKPYQTQIKVKETKEMAVKFVKFEKKDWDDFDAQEELDEFRDNDDNKKDGVESKYFEKMMENLGDFAAARSPFGGYNTPYADFAISEIHKRFFFIVGKLKFTSIQK